MGVNDALRPSGRTGGIDEECRFIGPGIRRQKRCIWRAVNQAFEGRRTVRRAAGGKYPCRKLVRKINKRFGKAAEGHRSAGIRMLEHIGDLFLAQQGILKHRQRAHLHKREHRLGKLVAVIHPHEDRHSLFDTVRRKSVGEFVHPRRKFGKAQLTVIPHECGPVAESPFFNSINEFSGDIQAFGYLSIPIRQRLRHRHHLRLGSPYGGLS